VEISYNGMLLLELDIMTNEKLSEQCGK
jgi:hypothetical protein